MSDNYLEVLQEGVLFKSKIEFWEKSIPGFLKALNQAYMIVRKYKAWHAKESKKEPDKWDPHAMLIRVEQQSVVSNIAGHVTKKQTGTEKYRFVVLDGDNAGAMNFKNSRSEYVVDSFEVALKL